MRVYPVATAPGYDICNRQLAIGNRQSIITLLTDFGTHDYFVGAMKGVILSRNPAASIVDITHEIPPQDIRAAAFNLLACYRNFPAGTIHVAVVDPGVGSERRAVLIECAHQFFVGPDNGLFSWICEREGGFSARQLTNEKFFRAPVSVTFHGRDVFAPVAAALSLGVAPEEFGEPLSGIEQLDSLTPKFIENTIEGRIIHIDRFGNCVTNVTAENLCAQGVSSSWIIKLNGREINSFRRFFSEARNGELFCLKGSAGFLELSARNASAAQLLGITTGDALLFISAPLREIRAAK
jgi:S-adenosyl-L-methionine hydrolase (adenosine-forming)